MGGEHERGEYPTVLPSRFEEAFVYARDLHRAQVRKGTTIPYIAHLMSVSALVIEHGGDEDQAIGALLHDAAEDQGGLRTLEVIKERFGVSVAEIVTDCTDAGRSRSRNGARARKAILPSCRKSRNAPSSSRSPQGP
jgi:(p)ppGpp synthase/HD superfamily hydrolase